MNQKTTDVLIVGGGVMGSAIAYNLLKKEPKLSVTVLERDFSYQKSSTVLSDGNLRVQFNVRENIEMSLYGLEVLERFSQEMATADHTPVIDFRQQGNIFVVDEAGKEQALQGLALQADLGAVSEWLEPAQIQEKFPPFHPDSCIGATFGPLDGTMSPLDVLLGYRRKAIELGAVFVETAVTALQKDGAQIVGVLLKNGDKLYAPVVVNATNAWAGLLTETIGISLPVKGIMRQVYSVEIDTHFDSLLPMLLLPTGQYLNHEGGNHFATGGALPSDPETYDDFSWSQARFEEHLWEGLLKYVPSFDRLKVVDGWAGLYAVNTLDGNAILGEWPELAGLYLVTGFSGHGFQQCHAVGRYLAELILKQPPVIDLSIFSPRRILENQPVFENKARII